MTATPTSRAAIAVVIPTHNRASLLPRAIRSVQQQTFEDWELVVVDDGSTDETTRYLSQLEDPRIVWERHDDPRGAAAARNTGIAESGAPLIAFLDDDDEYFPEFLSRIVGAFEAEPCQVGFGWAGTRWVRDIGDSEEFLRDDIWTPAYESRDAAYRGFLRNRRIGTNCGLVVRRGIFDEIAPFDPDFPTAEDTEFLIRAVRSFDFIALPEPLVKVHEHGGERLRASPRRAEAYDRIIEIHQQALSSDRRLHADLLYKSGWLHYHSGDRTRGRERLLLALRSWPFHVKSLAGLLLFEVLPNWSTAIHHRVSQLRQRLRPR